MKKLAKSLLAVMALAIALTGCLYVQYRCGGKHPKELSAPVQVKVSAPPDVRQLHALGLEPFQAKLPVMFIDTKGQQLLKEDTTWVRIAIMDNPDGPNDIMGPADRVMTATAKYRGASSYSGFDKMQYRIEFYHKLDGKPKNYALFGMGKDAEWVLNGPFLDRSLMRNALMYSLSRQVMDHAPDCRFFELFVDGAYQGIYLAVEPITDGGKRLALNQFSLMDGKTPYIIKRDRTGTERNILHTYGEEIFMVGNELSVSYPGSESLTDKQKLWIQEDVSRFERALYGENFSDPLTGYEAYIDTDSFVDYFILNEFAMNHDAGMLSTYAYKDMDQKLRVCVWDFNNCFDNYRWFAMDPEKFHTVDNNWFNRLIQDRDFADRIVNRYRELRKGPLSDENIRSLLRGFQEQLTDGVNRNFAVWGYTFQESLLSPGPDGELRDPHNYGHAVEQLRQCIRDRLFFLDNSIETLYDYCIN